MKRKRGLPAEENTRGQFLSILRLGLWGKGTDAPSGGDTAPDWKGILTLARTQAVLPLLYDGLEELPENLRPGNRSLMNLIAYVDKIEKLNGMLDEAAVTISERLGSSGIRSVLLKGQGLAHLYRHPGHRQCGDIDLYVGRENFLKAAEEIRKWPEISEEEPETEKHIGFRFRNMVLELHREAYRFMDTGTDSLFRKWEDEELSKDGCRVRLVADAPVSDTPETSSDGSVTVPPVTFNAFYIFAHGFRHFMQGGLGLRQLCDLALFLHRHHGDIDWNKLENRLREFRLFREWQLFMGLLTDSLGLPADEAPFYDPALIPLSEKMLLQVLSDGNFGHSRQYPDFSGKPRILRKIGNLGIHHLMLAKRMKFSLRHTLVFYRAMWRSGLANIGR